MRVQWVHSIVVVFAVVGAVNAQSPGSAPGPGATTPSSGPIRRSLQELKAGIENTLAPLDHTPAPPRPSTTPPFDTTPKAEPANTPPTETSTAETQPPAQPPAATTPSNDRPLATRKTDFYIPFDVPKNSSATELQLYVSSDLGLKWKLYGRETPASGKFRFLAAHDGEYWFHLHTVYAGNQTTPQGHSAQLKVLVDTTAPRLEADAQLDLKKNVRITWKAYDPHLSADTLAFSRFDSKANEWAPIADLRIDKKQQPITMALGAAIYTPPAEANRDRIRVTIADRSGNKAVIEKTVELPAEPKPIEPLVNNDAEEARPGVQTWKPSGSSDSPDSDTAAQNTVAAKPLASDQAATNGSADISADAAPAATENRFQPVASPIRPRVGNEAGESTLQSWKAPSGERPQMTKARRFQLAYDVNSVGPSGLARVSLWSTRDQGDTWTLFATDDDRTSPIDVNVPTDGVYGFVIVLEAGNGLTNDPPKAGDMADVWVGVDTSKPTGEITSAPYGVGPYAGHLTVKYQASDELLADKPITISFAERPEGPWTIIAAGLENTGEYQWRLDARVPRYIFLKLNVRDAAGNLAEHVLTRPVSVDGLAPKGKVTGLVPQP